MKTSRIEALADGIFAIAMTLLVLDLHVPASSEHLAADMLALIPRFLGLGVSFVILGIYWMGHHVLLARLNKVNMTFTWRTILFLLPISIVPFTAALLGSYPLSHIAQVLYALNLSVCGLLLFSCIHFAFVQQDFFEAKPSLEFKRNVVTKTMLPTAVYILTLPATFVSPWLGLLLLLLGPAISFVPIDTKTWSFLVKPTDWAYALLIARQ
jgi:uncharacterized membrane protein